MDKTFAPNLYRLRNEISKTEDKNEIEKIKEKYNGQLESDSLMSDLYAGTMIDYIHAKGRFNEQGNQIGTERKDKFLDIQLVAHGVHSLTESLENYVKPEEMTGEDKWKCDELNEFVDATKGFYFVDFPKLLTLHLKRFDYDRRTWTPIKLHHKIEFPFELDIKHLVPEDYDKETRYELFSCLVHSGSVTSGHYFAYIKDLTNGNWYEFNDSHVNPVTEEDVKRMYGRDEEINSYSSTNAYMLMYRRLDSNDDNTFHTNNIPNDMLDWVTQINLKVEKERQEEEIRRTMCQLDIHLQLVNIPNIEKYNLPTIKVQIPNFSSIKELKSISIQKFISKFEAKAIKDDIDYSAIWNRPIDCYRFQVLNYNSPGKLIIDEDTPIKNHVHNYGDLYLQVKDENEEWPADNRTITLYFYFLDLERHYFESRVSLEFKLSSKIKEIRTVLASNINYKGRKFTQELIGLTKKTRSPFKLINLCEPQILEQSFEEAGIESYDDIYVEILDFEGSDGRVRRMLELDEYYYILYFNHPDSNEPNNIYEGLKSETIDDMKSNISRMIQIPVNEFILSIVKQDGSLLSITDSSKKLHIAPGIFNNTRLYLKRGKPLAPGEFQVDVFQYITEEDYFKNKELEAKKKRAHQKKLELEAKRAEKKEKADENLDAALSTSTAPIIEDDPFLSNPNVESKDTSDISKKEKVKSYYIDNKSELFHHLGKITVSNATTVKELKESIASIYYKDYDLDLIRVRCKEKYDIQKILTPDDARLLHSMPRLSNYSEFAIQILKKKEELPKKPLIVTLRRWCSSTWTYGAVTEFWFDTSSVRTTSDLKSLISAVVDISVENLGIHKAPETLDNWHRKESNEIALLSWGYESNNIYDEPIRLKDGDTILYRDLTEEELYNLEDLEKHHGQSSYSHAYKSRFSHNQIKSSKQRDYETALKITTEFDDSPIKENQSNSNKKAETGMEMYTESSFQEPNVDSDDHTSNSNEEESFESGDEMKEDS